MTDTAMSRLLAEHPIQVETRLSRSEMVQFMQVLGDPSTEQWNFRGALFIVSTNDERNSVMRFKPEDVNAATYFKLRFATA